MRPYEREFAVVDVDEAAKLRGEGKTFKEIGEYFGCTRQAVQAKLKAHKRVRRRYQDIFEACPYIGLRNYMLSHKGFRISDLSLVLFGNAYNAALAKTRNMLYGRNTLLPISSIKNMEEQTGMSFAELFRRETDA